MPLILQTRLPKGHPVDRKREINLADLTLRQVQTDKSDYFMAIHFGYCMNEFTPQSISATLALSLFQLVCLFEAFTSATLVVYTALSLHLPLLLSSN